MVKIVKETVFHTNKRVWGRFKLSDGSVTKFEMSRADESWHQWGNNTDNLKITVNRVEQLCKEWMLLHNSLFG